MTLAAAGCNEGDSSMQATTNAGINSAPTLTGSPPTTASTGSRYSFKPASHDPDGDALTYSIRNKPAWAGFDATSGELSGTPTESNVGMSHGVEISVSDGYATTILPVFSIEVAYVETKSVTLSWVPPTAAADGSALFDLAGFRIYFGHRSGEFPFVIEVDNPGLTSFVVEDLAPGTYYFATTAVDRSGAESSLSEIVRITI